MIKVLFFEFPNTNNIGGIQKFVASYVKHFSNNIKVGIVASGEKYTMPNYWGKYGVDIYTAPSKKNVVAYINYIKNIIKQYDIVHINKNSLINIIPFYVAVHEKKKIVCHSHNTAPTVKSKLLFLHKLNMKYVVKHSDLLLSCSEKASVWMFGFNTVKQNKVIVINNAIEISKYQLNNDIRKKIRDSLGIAEGEIVLGHVGRFSEQKNHKFLISVFENINQKIQNSKLLLMGAGPLQEDIKKYVENQGLGKKVIFGGVKDNIEDYFMAMDCFVFPSLYEGLGIVVIEAQASGLNCFISDIIPKEVALTKLVKFLPVNRGAKFWADQILNSNMNFTRCNVYNDLVDAGYEISVEARKLENLYIQLMK